MAQKYLKELSLLGGEGTLTPTPNNTPLLDVEGDIAYSEYLVIRSR